MLYYNIINTKTKRLCKDIIEKQMIYQIKGGFYEGITLLNNNDILVCVLLDIIKG